MMAVILELVAEILELVAEALELVAEALEATAFNFSLSSNSKLRNVISHT